MADHVANKVGKEPPKHTLEYHRLVGWFSLIQDWTKRPNDHLYGKDLGNAIENSVRAGRITDAEKVELVAKVRAWIADVRKALEERKASEAACEFYQKHPDLKKRTTPEMPQSGPTLEHLIGKAKETLMRPEPEKKDAKWYRDRFLAMQFLLRRKDDKPEILAFHRSVMEAQKKGEINLNEMNQLVAGTQEVLARIDEYVQTEGHALGVDVWRNDGERRQNE